MKNADFGPALQGGNLQKTNRISWTQYILEAFLALLSVSFLLVVIRAVPFRTFPSAGISLMDIDPGGLLSRDRLKVKEPRISVNGWTLKIRDTGIITTQ